MTKGLRFIIALNIIWLGVILWAAGDSIIYSWRLSKIHTRPSFTSKKNSSKQP